MLINRIGLCSIFASIILTGCNLNKGYVWYEGPISAETVSYNIELMETSKNIGTFYISSGGGDSEEGKRLGQYLISRNIKVVAVGKCYSACANYVLLPAKSRGMTKWAKLGMHGGDRSYLNRTIENIATIPDRFMPVAIISLKNSVLTADVETRLLLQAGIKPEIIEKSAQETLNGAIRLILEYEKKDGEFIINEKRNTEYELWFPAESDYDKWGISIQMIDEKDLPQPIYEQFKDFADSERISHAP